MDFTFKPLEDTSNQGVILAQGDIQPGDDEKLHGFVAALPGNTTLIGIALSSPGGNLLEGVRLATTVRNTGLATGAFGTCASACFLIFAAGTRKFAFEGARIGVHSASVLGVETTGSQAMTTQMARTAADFGVPPAIIGKMVTTAADDVAWLSPDDLRSMNVEPLARQASYRPGSPLRPGGASPASAGIDPASGPAPVSTEPKQVASAGDGFPAGASPAFLAGRRARMDYETWFGSISGDVRAGAEWWAGVRSHAQRDHLACGTGTPLWIAGCKQAQTVLAPSDSQRRADADFRAGWNSL